MQGKQVKIVLLQPRARITRISCMILDILREKVVSKDTLLLHSPESLPALPLQQAGPKGGLLIICYLKPPIWVLLFELLFIQISSPEDWTSSSPYFLLAPLGAGSPSYYTYPCRAPCCHDQEHLWQESGNRRSCLIQPK